MNDLVKQYVSIWNNNSISELGEVFTKQSKYWDSNQEGEAIELLTGSIAATHEAFSDISFQIISLKTTIENQVFLEWKMTGTNSGEFFGYQPTGKVVEIRGLDSIRLEANKIAEIKSFFDSSLFSQQLGLQ